MTNLYHASGTAAKDGWQVQIDDAESNWSYTGVRVGQFGQAESFSLPADNWERAIWPLSGDGILVEYLGSTPGARQLRGRKSVFHGPADFLFLPRNTAAKITGAGRFIVAEAKAKADATVQFTAKEDVQVTMRGAGPATRQVHDYGGVDFLEASAMIVVEVIVPSGNHSGVPPHKHDTFVPGVESNLEEIYYFELAPDRNQASPDKADPIGYFRAYSSDDRIISEAREVRNGDVCLVPFGFHGPVSATPPYDLYFMNVMAGPDPERTWNIVDDPNHAWARKTWENLAPDSRLPYLAD